jgi:hypothetical protein
VGEKYLRRQAMKKILILVEGQTEETLVKRILYPYLETRHVYCTPKVITTKPVKSGPNFKGGITSYDKVKKEIRLLLQDSSADVVTTMIDFYGFSNLVPFKKSIRGRSCFERVNSLEKLFKRNIDSTRFIPYLQLHEFEAMVFVSPTEVVKALNKEDREKELLTIRTQFSSPEEIDDHPDTAPSKRLLAIFPTYRKTLHGPLIINRIGLKKIRNECSHFNQWISRLEQL